MYRELLIGCGHRKDKHLWLTDQTREWQNLTTLDINPAADPDIVWNLEHFPLPFDDNTFDEIHAYEVLEHTGQQGDWRFFFKQWNEFHRIIKPEGLFFGTVPKWDSFWAWGDPSHTRVINAGTLGFLNRNKTHKDGSCSSSDFHEFIDGDWYIHLSVEQGETYAFCLKAGDSYV